MPADETFSFDSQPVGKQKSSQTDYYNKNQEDSQVDISEPFEMQ
jgi:hypothetical protein